MQDDRGKKLTQLVSFLHSTCGMSPRRPRSLLPHSPSPPRANSPISGGK